MSDTYINNKLKYKIKLFNYQTFNIDTSSNNYKVLLQNNIININDCSFSIDESLNKILYIFQVNNNEYNLLINQKHIIKLDKIISIDLLNNNYYKCSINIPIGLKNSSVETLINLKYSIEKYRNYDYQINILHTDSYIYTIDEIALANDNLNYIFVENPYNFNLGYTRNLYKYLSLSDNILFIDCDIPLDEKYIDKILLDKAIKKSQLNDFIDSLPEKLNTIIGERGIRISGGQKQRIGIARALYHDPQILIFDESTSSLDPNTEEKLVNSINKLRKSKTIIMVSHRHSTLEKCDEKYFFKNKKLSKIS